MPKYPCKNCPDRYPACHDHCERYNAIKARDRECRDAERLHREAYQYTMDNIMKNNDYNVKKRRNGRLTYSKKG